MEEGVKRNGRLSKEEWKVRGKRDGRLSKEEWKKE